MITRKQYKKLKSIKRFHGTRATDYDKNKDLYVFLCSNGYIKKSDVHERRGYVITQNGEIEIKLYREDIFRFWITTIISFIALLTSILSISLQSETVQKILEQLFQ